MRLLTILRALQAVLLFWSPFNISCQRFVRCIRIEVLIYRSVSMNEHLLLWLILFCVIIVFNKDHLLVAYFMIFNISCICSSIHCQLLLCCDFGHGRLALSSIFCHLVDISVGELFIADSKTLVKILFLSCQWLLPCWVLNDSRWIIIATVMETCEVYLWLVRISVRVQAGPVGLEAL